MSRGNSITGGLFWSTLEAWGTRITSLVTVVILARILGPETFGLLSAAMLYVGFIDIVVRMGFNTALIQYEDLRKEHADSVFSVTFPVSAFFIILSWLLAPYGTLIVDDPEIIDVIRALSFILLLNGFSVVGEALLTREMRFKQLAARRFCSDVAGTIVGLVLAIGGAGVWALVVKQLVNSAVAAVMLFATSSWSPSLRFSRQHINDLWRFNLNVFGSNILYFLHGNVYQYIIVTFFGAYGLGIFTISSRILVVLRETLTKSLQRVLLPALSRLQNDPAGYRGLYFKCVRIVALISFPVYLILGLTAPVLIPLVYGDQWYDSIVIMQYLLIGQAVLGVASINNTLLLATGHSGSSLKLHLLGFFVSGGIAYWAKDYGMEAMALGMSGSILIHQAALLLVVNAKTDLRIGRFIRSAGLPALTTLLAGFLGIYLTGIFQPAGLPNSHIVPAVAISVCIYMISSLILFKKDVRLLLEKLRFIKPVHN